MHVELHSVLGILPIFSRWRDMRAMRFERRPPLRLIAAFVENHGSIERSSLLGDSRRLDDKLLVILAGVSYTRSDLLVHL